MNNDKPQLALPFIHIEVQANGSLSVSGAIDNKVAAYGLLEWAKEAVADHHRGQASGSKLAMGPLPKDLIEKIRKGPGEIR